MDLNLTIGGLYKHSDFKKFGKVPGEETDEAKGTREVFEDKLLAWVCINFLQIITGKKPLIDQVCSS